MLEYKRQSFTDDVTVVKATHFNHIEDGIDNIVKSVNEIETRLGNFVPITELYLMSVKIEDTHKLTIRCKDWTDTDDFIWTFNGVGSKNLAANLLNCGTIAKSVQDDKLTYNMNKESYKSCTDDTAPVQFCGSYFAGNHAMTGATRITVNSHGLTSEDIGSTWLDSDLENPTQYMLVAVENNTRLLFMNLDELVTSGNGAFNYSKHKPISPLVHVKNATHITDIEFTSYVNSEQLWAGSNHVQNKYLIDDIEVTTDSGLFQCNKVANVCSFDIIYIPAIIEYLESNIGHNTNTSFYSEDIKDKYMHIEVVHEFRPNGSLTTYCKYKIDERKDLTFSYIYTAQCAAFGKPTYLYVPDTNNNEILLHDGTNSFYFNKPTWNDENTPPYRYFAFNSELDKGFLIIFSKDTYWGKPENRVNRVNKSSGTGAGWSPSSCKLYPIWTSGLFSAGSSFESITGRIPINKKLNDAVTAVGWYWDNDDVILTIDSHSKCSTLINLPAYLVGKKIEIIDMSDSVISYPLVTSRQTLYYTTNSDLGHLVLRLYD